VPFRVIYAGRNLGYAGANNLGVSHAKADHLVLLNSDIIPSEAGWLSRTEQKLQKLHNVGVTGLKLVFEDETIQHIGINFLKNPQFGDVWLNDHPGKGTPQWLLDIEDISEVAVVTGACMFIEKSLFESIGGFDEGYVLGDFEDSDLCLKLYSNGFKNYVINTEKLYHLERQSQNLFENQDWKFKITLYNAWQHTERWGSVINKIEEGQNKP
jgi:GT2 family glycosyltransferase